jgi:hypothetical protein
MPTEDAKRVKFLLQTRLLLCDGLAAACASTVWQRTVLVLNVHRS